MIQINRDPQTGLTTIVLNDAALAGLVEALDEFSDHGMTAEIQCETVLLTSTVTVAEKLAAIEEITEKLAPAHYAAAWGDDEN